MNWGSVSNFLAMGGAGPFVWGSFGLTLAIMVLEPVLAARRYRQARRAAAASAVWDEPEDGAS